jgi:hypothetical protein
MSPQQVKAELELCKQEKANRSHMDSWWQTIKEVTTPRNAYITRQTSGVPVDDFDRIHDTTIIESAEGLSNMMTGELTPAGERWIQFDPPFEFEDDEEVVNWYAECSRRVLKLLNNSNFQTVQADVNLERATVGTGMMMCYETNNPHAPFRFKHAPVGTYTFNEDLDGVADGFRREFQGTPAQLRKEFPKGQFGAKFQGAWNDAKKRHTEKFTVWHIVKPREEREPGKLDATSMEYAEFYILEEDEILIEETGQHEFNAMVSRFQSGADGNPWGVSPARKAMPATAQANFLQEQMDILLHLQINPRILSEAGMVGNIDLRPGQKTLTRAGALATPGGGVREWLTGGQYPLGQDRIKDKQEQIRKLFYHGLWADLARVEKEMTAEEVRAIRDQSQMLFVGVNARFEADMKPLMTRRLFGICLRKGIFTPPPPQLLKEVHGFYDIPDPLATFQTRIAQVVQRKKVEASDQLFARLERLFQADPSLVDEFDLAIHARELARSFGYSNPFIRTEDNVIQIKQAQERAMAQEQQQQALATGAESMGKLDGGVQKQLLQNVG